MSWIAQFYALCISALLEWTCILPLSMASEEYLPLKHAQRLFLTIRCCSVHKWIIRRYLLAFLKRLLIFLRLIFFLGTDVPFGHLGTLESTEKASWLPDVWHLPGVKRVSTMWVFRKTAINISLVIISSNNFQLFFFYSKSTSVIWIYDRFIISILQC